MQALGIITHILIILFALDTWRRHNDKTFIWVAIVNAVALLLHGWNYAANTFFRLSPELSILNSVALIILWSLSFVITVVLVARGWRSRT